MFLIWCRRGVDGFRCDAGYKVPLRAWRYITARVLEEFPETIFLLEGLGGSWEATENLLTEGGMQWAYSELFQNYSGAEVASYLEYALKQSTRLGLYVHYSETHDNIRLAAKGRDWSLLRNRLCALTSVSGGFGFTCGVEWLATERINVHSSRGLAWGNQPNLVKELAQLNELLRSHPCFFDGATLKRVSQPDASVFALLRESADKSQRVVVVVNADMEKNQIARFDPALFCPEDLQPTSFDPKLLCDLLGQKISLLPRTKDGSVVFEIPPAAALCLSIGTPMLNAPTPNTSRPCQPVAEFSASELPATLYSAARARAAWAVSALGHVLPPEEIGAFDWRVLADWVNRDPKIFLGALCHLDPEKARHDLLAALFTAMEKKRFSRVVTWELLDRRRITLVPSHHWLLVHDPAPFRATLETPGAPLEHVQSVPVQLGHVAFFAPRTVEASIDVILRLERYADQDQRVDATLRFLTSNIRREASFVLSERPQIVLLTNGRGGMARLCVDFGNITSKYDCLLGANLNATLPVDRHVFVKRARLWLVADGFVTPLNLGNLTAFEAGPPARWTFLASAGDGRAVEIEVSAEMVPLQNTMVLRFHRPARPASFGSNLPPEAHVSLTVRVDIEDRNFHCETHRNGGAERHFGGNTRTQRKSEVATGFVFTPAPDRQLRVFADGGRYHPQPEWCENIPHPVEATRGQPASGDAYSPGWFEVPLNAAASATLIATAEPDWNAAQKFSGEFSLETEMVRADEFHESLVRAVKAFVVRRDGGKTIIAGYPWFLDWGRDSLICARGLIAANMLDDVRDLLLTFARFEENGTLPNTIHGANATNRDTSDAPLWFGVACEELETKCAGFRETRVDQKRTITDVLRSIALNYIRGTPNGIRVDPESALIWSPSHFTWMDTNFPAGTPREGYPIEIQALWIRLLKQLHQLGVRSEEIPWNELAARAETSLQQLFWIEERGWFADVLGARAGVAAKMAERCDALRSNSLFPISLGLVAGLRAQWTVDAVARYLVVPGALRSLAPLRVTPPMPVYGNHGGVINDPPNPYWPRYEGDEDTRRKPAYHNGTAWSWTFPSFCEALAAAWAFDPASIDAARNYLLSMRDLMFTGCAGHMAEIFDGDAPHTARGCDAQAWSATEALRVWTLLRAAK
jgi:predicted glycogen debranching enzyme